ncbi:hypothetical protein [Paenibacillus nasutitermitis]|uniref:Uncharacterized protein n=1 Tax=Paenibacillus nasutitermitis TaxID=1652958 RepID=A0A916YRA0_9BACL|nr:hypothetical protein [Paenibacillus nasutitermitis]GGD57902.1 hypothetical protein GCM10010911_14620 [Paenibacillus nasutitermitis]
MIHYFHSIMKQQEFWTDYYWMTEEDRSYPALADNPVELRLSEGSALLVDIEEELMDVTLLLSGRLDGEPVQLGWDDQVHFHPYVFRWAELEAISKHLRAEDPDAGFIPFLLLYRFAAITQQDDLNHIRSTVEAAWRSLDLYSEGEIQAFIKQTIRPLDNAVWTLHPRFGWVLEGEAYTLRHAGNEEFPYDDLQKLLNQADA